MIVKGEQWLPLAAVTVVHIVVGAFLLSSMSHNETPIEPPAIVGMLISPTTMVEAPKPLSVEPTPPKPQPIARPKPLQPPPPHAPSSERAVAAPPPAPTPSSSAREDAVVSPPAQPVEAAPAAPPVAVVPPRTDAEHLNNPETTYPPISKRLREQGRVLLDVYILADGSVGEIKLNRSSGYVRLDDAAREAVRRWRYIPARRGNEPIPYWYVQPITFSLEG